jgi:hypothetical protein
MNDKLEIRDGVEYTYSSDWIRSLEARKHWEYYWFQQKLMEGLVVPNADSVLEVGVGSGFAANYMRSKGITVKTLDIDPDKKPDIVGNVVDYNFPERYDSFMAFEILEHIPYVEFEKIVKKLPTFVNKYAFISLPRNLVSLLSGHLKVPKLPALSWDVRIKRRKIVTANHHWELDFDGHSLDVVERFFISSGLAIARKLAHGNINFYALRIDPPAP